MDLRVEGTAQPEGGTTFRLPAEVARGKIVRSATSRGAVSTMDLWVKREVVSTPRMPLPVVETVIVMLDGACEVRTDGGSRIIEPGTCCRVSGVVQSHRSWGGQRTRRVIFHLTEPTGIPELRELDEKALRLTTSLIAEAERPDSLAREAAALSLLAHLVEVGPSAGGIAERARARMRADLGAPVRLDKLARALGVGSRALTRAVRARYGLSVFGLLTKDRVERARTRLQVSSEPVGAIGVDLGFSSPSHFSKVFREHTGMSPTAYRRACEVGWGRPGQGE